MLAPLRHVRETLERLQTSMLKWFRLQKTIPHHHGKKSSESDNSQLFRKGTGHCRLNKHLHRLDRHPNGKCEQCQVPERVDHFLWICPTYQPERIKLKRATESLNIDFTPLPILSDDQAAKHVEEFMHISGRQIWTQLHKGLALEDRAVIKHHKNPIIIIIIIIIQSHGIAV